MNHNPKPQVGLPDLGLPQSPTTADSVGAERATPRNDPPIGNSSRASQPAMTNRTLGTNTQDETRAEDGASSGQSLRQALDRLATQLDDTTHHGMGLVIRLMIESRVRDARERQSAGYPLVEEMRRLRLPLDGPPAQDASLRFLHAAATPGTSSGWLAMLEKNLFADIVLVEELAEKGEGGYLAIASAGKLTIADLVSHLVHLRKRLTFWAGTLETYPPPLVHDVVGLVADAAKQLRYAANFPYRESPSLSSGFGPESGLEARAQLEVPLTKDQILVLSYLAKKRETIVTVAEITQATTVRSKQTVTKILRVLESRGLSERPPVGEGRGRHITPAGLERVRKIQSASQLER